MAMGKRSLRQRMSHSTIGDLPVPPTARLPTQMIGRLKDAEGRRRLSKSQLRALITRAYISETGNNNRRIGLKRNELTFIAQFQCSGSGGRVKVRQISCMTCYSGKP